MLERYVHPTESLRVNALDTASFAVKTAPNWPHPATEATKLTTELKDFFGKTGGRRRDRTGGLRVANAALSQLS